MPKKRFTKEKRKLNCSAAYLNRARATECALAALLRAGHTFPKRLEHMSDEHYYNLVQAYGRTQSEYIRKYMNGELTSLDNNQNIKQEWNAYAD